MEPLERIKRINTVAGMDDSVWRAQGFIDIKNPVYVWEYLPSIRIIKSVSACGRAEYLD